MVFCFQYLKAPLDTARDLHIPFATETVAKDNWPFNQASDKSPVLQAANRVGW